jgi:signal transduction histidine kinase
MASHVAHEVRNNLVPVTLYLSLLRRRISDEPGSLEILEKIEAGFTALEAIVHDLLHFTSDRQPRFQTCAIGPLVQEVYASLAPQLAAQGIAMVTEVGDECRATADRDMLRRAVLNLVLNAIDAMPDGGELFISANVSDHGVVIGVEDTGPGVSDETAKRAFEPFFTTKCGGTGLGLAIVQRIVEVHGGEVRVGNRGAGGAVFTLRIPHPAKEAAA